jgi:putative oxidoreductase
METSYFDKHRDWMILAARVLMMLLMVRFGWSKISSVSHTIQLMSMYGLPLPGVAATLAILAECGGGVLLIIGFWTRPLALLLAVYTLGTALVAHRYWTMSGSEMMQNMINFYKNLSIIGGLVLLAVTGAGRYSVDGQRGRAGV